MAYQLFYDPRPIQLLDTFEPCAGGTLQFFVNGDTNTPKVVYSQADGTSLGSTVELDSAGRSATPIYLDGAYSVRLLDADDVMVWETDDVNNFADGGLIPLDPADGEEDQVYSTDGVSALWRTIREVLDPTGETDKFLKSDGEGLLWASIPTYSATNLPGGITQGSTSFQIGKLLVQTGTATLPTAAGNAATIAVTFGTAYATFLGLVPMVATSSGSTSQGGTPILSYSGNTTGATIRGYAGDEHEAAPAWHLTSTTPIFYVAFGLVA